MPTVLFRNHKSKRGQERNSKDNCSATIFRSCLEPKTKNFIYNIFICVYIVVSCVLYLLALVNGAEVFAATLTVNKTSDSADGNCSDSDCSLREAIIAANSSPGMDIIVIPPGTFTLTLSGDYENSCARGDLDITDDIVITGAGLDQTVIKCNMPDRIFHILPGASAHISNLTIEGGVLSCPQLGGNLLNEGILHLSNMLIKDGTACNGGGIGNSGTIDFSFTTIADNKALATMPNTGFGGGIFNNIGGVLRMYDSEVRGNQADADGGGLYDLSDIDSGALIYIERAVFSYNQSNSLGGGVASLGNLTIKNSSITDNSSNDGGGILCLGQRAHLQVHDVLFMNNTAAGLDLGGGGAVFNYQGVALITGSRFLSNTALGEGGGAISNRGSLEIRESSFESNSALYHLRDSLPDDTSPGLGGALLLIMDSQVFVQDCIFKNNRADVNGGAIYNDFGSNLTISYTTIEGNEITEGPNGLFGGGINNEGNLNISNSVLRMNSALSAGGGISNSKGITSATSCVFEDNHAGSGGAITNFLGGAVYIFDSQFQSNTASKLFGGALFSDTGGYCDISSSQFAGNKASKGGAVSNYEGQLFLSGCSFENNTALQEGGGAIWNKGVLTVMECQLQRNKALFTDPMLASSSPGFGGGLLLLNGSTSFLFDCSLKSNEAAVNGGAIYNDRGAELEIADSEINDNRVIESQYGLYGGAILNQGTLTLRRTTVERNIGKEHGGGIDNAFGKLFISECSFNENRANSAGGIGNFAGGKAYIVGSTFAYNVADSSSGIGFGGALLNDAGSIIYILNSTISGNHAQVGGGISNNFSTEGVHLRNVTLASNIASVGSAIYNWAGKVELANNIISGSCNTLTGGGWTISYGGNLEGPGDTCGLDGKTDRAFVSEMRLLPLGDNGGLTETHALEPESPARERAVAFESLIADQRGSPRPIDGDNDGSPDPDAGSFEYGSAPRPQVEIAIQSLLNNFYQKILFRDPDADGAEWWKQQIKIMRGLGIATHEGFIVMAKLFFNSPEYIGFAKSDEDYVRDLYNTFLDREPDANGLAAWMAMLSIDQETGKPLMTRNEVMNGFVFSQEFKEVMISQFGLESIRPESDMIINFYRGFLTRLPDISGFLFWVKQIREAQCASNSERVKSIAREIAFLFIGSEEYLSRNRSNSEYIEDLYDAIMRRTPDPEGKAFWLNMLETGSGTREKVLEYFISDSYEFQENAARIASVACYPGTY